MRIPGASGSSNVVSAGSGDGKRGHGAAVRAGPGRVFEDLGSYVKWSDPTWRV